MAVGPAGRLARGAVAALAVVVLAPGCAGRWDRLDPPPAAGGDPELPGWTAAVQELYRVRYDGPEGGGGLRLALRTAGEARYRLEASDTFGRALWTVEAGGERSLLVDHVDGRLCPAEAVLALPGVELADLELAALPRLLRGEVPIAVADQPPEGRTRTAAPGGVEWSVAWEAGSPRSWMRTVRGEPTLWFSRAAEGGVLSHRRGAQIRWRRVAREEGRFELPALAIPAGYRADACGDLAAPVDSRDPGF